MPRSKLRKALGAVKDQTSLSLAKVSNNVSTLDIAILKATTHDEYPTDDRYINDVLKLVSSSKAYAAGCVQSISKRIGKTRNWVVALKSLILVLKIFQNGDPHFPCEVFHAMKHGAKLLNLSGFRDDSNSSPWDYTAFVRTFALYLDERLDCFLTGKLQKRFMFKGREENNDKLKSRRANEPVRDMKPAMLLDRISYWQRLIERIIATRPTGAARTNRLVQISLYTIVQESFDLYRDISDGLALLLDSFFHLQYQSCVSAFQTCVKASKQFEELGAFYTLCKSIGVGRTSEYPSVQKISDELVETLQEFLKDQSSFPTSFRSPPNNLLLLPAPPPSTSKDLGSFSSRRDEGGDEHEQCYSEVSESTEKSSERDSEFGLRKTSLEELMFITDACPSIVAADHESSSSTENIEGIDAFPQYEHKQEKEHEELDRPKGGSSSRKSAMESWELVLAEIAVIPAQTEALATTTSTPNISNTSDPNLFDGFYNQDSSTSDHHFNPFLQDTTELTAISTATANAQTEAEATFPSTDLFSMAPTFQATPTFSAQSPNETVEFENENDPFASISPTNMGDEHMFDGSSMSQKNVLHEQQLWLQHQNKIIAKNMT